MTKLPTQDISYNIREYKSTESLAQSDQQIR